ncbi:CGNR zinc finger domain-containing protein [Kitasatospora sp. NPDC059646]|uniref:CGNR zinc finger domain-containing protein n=1 Tax=Kitasatospora sp. NPDC059646 TaxID=3346893 RepID=UPI0036935D1A
MAGTVQAHTFEARDLLGGYLVLDLTNTVTARDTEPVDWLDGYPRLLEWAALTGEFDPTALGELRRLATADPAGAARALDRVRELREAVHDLVTTLLDGSGPAPATAAERVETHWKPAVAAARLAVRGGSTRPEVDVETSGLDFLGHDLALRAVDLLRSAPWERVRVCAGQRCGWVFIDKSRGGGRRWCSMATCGNSAKGRTHYRRKQHATHRHNEP